MLKMSVMVSNDKDGGGRGVSSSLKFPYMQVLFVKKRLSNSASYDYKVRSNLGDPVSKTDDSLTK